MVFVKQDLPDGKKVTGDGFRPMMDRFISPTRRSLSKATQPQLGINDPYELTETQYQAVLKVLQDQHPLVHRYWHDATVQMSDFKKTKGWLLPAHGHIRPMALKAKGSPLLPSSRKKA